jgi:hypothetical protein
MSRPYPRLFTFALIALVACVSACTAAAPTPLADQRNLGFVVSSNAFTAEAAIPKKFACDGENASPQLKWSGAPQNTKSFALIMDDPDAPGGTFTHWVAYDIPATQTEIAEGTPVVGKGGKNGRGQTSYTGPCPPSGTHRYFFTLYAVDLTTLGLNDAASRADVETAMKLHTLAVTQLLGRYSR